MPSMPGLLSPVAAGCHNYLVVMTAATGLRVPTRESCGVCEYVLCCVIVVYISCDKPSIFGHVYWFYHMSIASRATLHSTALLAKQTKAHRNAAVTIGLRHN